MVLPIKKRTTYFSDESMRVRKTIARESRGKSERFDVSICIQRTMRTKTVDSNQHVCTSRFQSIHHAADDIMKFHSHGCKWLSMLHISFHNDEIIENSNKFNGVQKYFTSLFPFANIWDLTIVICFFLENASMNRN